MATQTWSLADSIGKIKYHRYHCDGAGRLTVILIVDRNPNRNRRAGLCDYDYDYDQRLRNRRQHNRKFLLCIPNHIGRERPHPKADDQRGGEINFLRQPGTAQRTQ